MINDHVSAGPVLHQLLHCLGHVGTVTLKSLSIFDHEGGRLLENFSFITLLSTYPSSRSPCMFLHICGTGNCYDNAPVAALPWVCGHCHPEVIVYF